MKNNKIDIIIPIYNNSNIQLFQCLSSIATQTIIKDIKVTIVDDASTEQNYEKIISLFKDFLDIQLLRLEENGGPGVARQYGIDHTENEYIAFIDADDFFVNGIALELFRSTFKKNPEMTIVCGRIHKQRNDNFIILPKGFLFGIGGKMYKRDFLTQNNIRFNRKNMCSEDICFNGECQFFLLDKNLGILDYETYCYTFNKESLTNQDNFLIGAYQKSMIIGFIEHQIECYNKYKNNLQISNQDFIEHFIFVQVVIYWYYINIEKHNKNIEEVQNAFKACKKFYNQVYINLFNDEYFQKKSNEIIYKAMRVQYEENDICKHIIPNITFSTFLNLLNKGD